MAKIWLKIWLKVKENGTKKIKLAKMVAKEKEILKRTLKRIKNNYYFSEIFEQTVGPDETTLAIFVIQLILCVPTVFLMLVSLNI